MKKMISLFGALCISFFATGQQANDLLGKWKSGEGTGIIEIFKTTSGHFAGKLVWLKDPIDPETGKPKLDKRNPDVTKRSNPTLGTINLYGFTFDKEEKIWKGGRIYDPKKGKEYSSKIKMIDANTIDVRGYVGISLIGRTDTWIRQAK